MSTTFPPNGVNVYEGGFGVLVQALPPRFAEIRAALGGPIRVGVDADPDDFDRARVHNDAVGACDGGGRGFWNRAHPVTWGVSPGARDLIVAAADATAGNGA